VFAHRPQLRMRDWLLLAWRTLTPQRAGRASAA
jgi:hypothetical protein